jgi:phage-related protein
VATLAKLVTSLALDANPFHSGLERVVNYTKNAGATITGFLTDMGSNIAGELAVRTFDRITGSISGVVRTGLNFNNAMEQASAKINAFTKDGAATAKILSMVQTEAAKTPFAFQEMVDAAAGLGPLAKQTGMDLQDLIGQAEVLAASNPAQGLEGAVFALREAAGGDFASVIDRFNLSRQTINRLKAEGVPAIEAVSMAMKEMGYDSDLVANMGKTLEGRWSTLQDTFTTLAGKVTQPIFDKVSSSIGELQSKLDGSMPSFEAIATAIGEKLGAAVSWVIDTGAPALIGAFGKISEVFGTVITVVKSVVTAFTELSGFSTKMGLIVALQTLGDQVPALKPITDWLQKEVPTAIAIATAAFDGIQTVITTVRDVFLTFSQALSGDWENSDQILLVHQAFGILGTFLHDTVFPILQTVVDWFRVTIPEAVSFFRDAFAEGGVAGVFQAILDKIVELMPGIQPFTDWLQVVIPEAISTATGIIQTIIDSLQALWDKSSGLQGGLDGAKTAIQTFGDTIGNVTTFLQEHQGVVAILVGLVTALGTYYVITTAAALAWGAAQLVLNGAVTITNTLVAVLNALMSANPIGLVIIAVAALAAGFIYLYNNSKTFRDEVNRLWADFQLGLVVIENWASGVKQRWDDLVSDFQRGWTLIQVAAQVFWNWLITTSVTTFTSLVTTVGEKLNAVVTFFTGLPGRITGAIGDVGNLLADTGRKIIQSLLNGVNSAWDGIKKRFSELTNLIPSWKGPPEKDAKLLFENGRLIIQGLIDGFGDMKPKIVEKLSDITDLIGKVFGVVSGGTKALTDLAGYKPGLLRDTVLLFANDLAGVVSTIEVVTRDFKIKAMEAAAKWAESAGKVVGLIGSGVTALIAIKTYKTGLTRDMVLQFAYDVYGVVSTLQAVTENFNQEGVAAAALWSESAGKIVGIISSAVGAMSSLRDYHGILPNLLDGFAADLRLLIMKMTDLASQFDIEATQAAGIFAEAAGKIIAPISNSVDAFAKLREYKGAMPWMFDMLGADIQLVIRKMLDLASQFNTDGVQAAAVFSDAVGKILAPLSSAIETFNKLRDYKGVVPETFKLFASDLMGVIGHLIAVVKYMSTDGLDAALTFYAAAQKIIGAVSGGLDLLNKFRDYKGLEAGTVDRIFGDMHSLLDRAKVEADSQGSLSGFAFVDAWNRQMIESTPDLIVDMNEVFSQLYQQAVVPSLAKMIERFKLDGGWMMIALGEGISGNHSAIDAAAGMGNAIADAVNAGLDRIKTDIVINIHSVMDGQPTTATPDTTQTSVGNRTNWRPPDISSTQRAGGDSFTIQSMDLRGTSYSLDEIQDRFQAAIVATKAPDDEMVQRLRRGGT